MTEKNALPKCGCGGEPLHKYIKLTKQHAVRCAGCGLSTNYFDTEDEAKSAWTRAMTRAPALEALRADFIEYLTEGFRSIAPEGRIIPETMADHLITLIRQRAALGQAAQKREDLADRLFAAIEHGDEGHRQWLKDKLAEFFAGEPHG